MSEALRTVELPAEAIALIKEGTPTPKAAKGILKSSIGTLSPGDQPAAVNRHEATLPLKTAHRGEQGRTEASGTGISMKFKPGREAEPVFAAMANWGSITVRVPTDLPARLLRVATDRKLSQLRPWTQQEIVAEALSQWLKKNGY